MNILTKLRYVPKHFAVVVATVIAGATVASSFAWGPTRDTYTVAKPADHITFNSITDNPNAGDERNFVVVKDAANTQSGGWQDSVNVEANKEYLVRVYVHNNAADNLNLTAVNTRVMAALGTNTGTKVGLTGYVSADNASPKEVYDDVYFNSATPFNMAYVSGSAKIYNNATGQTGRAVSDSIMNGSGALVGYNANDGKLPGCFQYASYVTFKVKPQLQQTPDFSIAKTVRLNGATDKTFKESVAAKPGDKVDFQVYFKNTGSTLLNKVAIRDTLPAGLTYVTGSTWLHNSGGTNQVADGVTVGGGIMIGDYAKDGDAYVKFTAQVAANNDLATCGLNTLKNIASVDTSAGSKSDDAVVTVDKTCDNPQPVAKYTCDLLTVNKIERTKFSFDTKYTAENVTFVRVNYAVRDAAGKELYRGINKDFTATTPGTYSVESFVVVKVDGTDKTVTSANCKKQFTVELTPVVEKDIKVCDLTTGTLVTIKESAFDNSKYSKNLDDCKNINVCRLSDKQMVTIKESAFDSTKHSRSTEDCKPAPVTPTTPTTPVTPTTNTPAAIASTGPEVIVGGLFGSSALGLGISSYVRSRSALKTALMQK